MPNDLPATDPPRERLEKLAKDIDESIEGWNKSNSYSCGDVADALEQVKSKLTAALSPEPAAGAAKGVGNG